MRNFDHFLTYCHVSQREASRKRFYDSAYMDAFKRVENYEDNYQSGHFQQLFYATYDFLTANRSLISQISTPPFEISSNRIVFNAWSNFLMDTVNSTGEYDVRLLSEKLPNSCGGTLYGGGGWSPTLKIMFPVVAKYINN